MIKNVLIVGDMRIGTNARSVADAFARNVSTVHTVDISPTVTPRIMSSEWLSLRAHAMASAAEQDRVANLVRQCTRNSAIDLILAIKPVQYDQGIFLDAPAALRAHLSFDDVSNPDNTSSAYLSTESQWDAIVTTKLHNVAELESRGAKKVVQIWGAFDPTYRYLTTPYLQRRYRVGFIGAARPDRRNLPRQLGRRIEESAVIVGPRWRRHYPLGAGRVQIRSGAYGEAHLAVANQIKIGLLLLNSDNRDTHTNRSFEMPATGQMVLGQRTLEHEMLFEDGRTAVLFDEPDEMLDKIEYFDKNTSAAEKIAQAGHRSIWHGGNTYDDRAKTILDTLSQ